MHQIWRGREEREKKKRNQRAKKREKRNKGRVSERQRAGIFFFSFLSFFFSTSALSFSFRFNETIKNWSLFAFSLHDNIVYYRFSRRPLYHGRPPDQTRCSLIRKTVTCCAPRERKNQIFWLFWRRVSNHWINPHNRRTNDPFPNLLPPFFLSSFFFCARSCAASSSYVTEFQSKTISAQWLLYSYFLVDLWRGERGESKYNLKLKFPWRWKKKYDGDLKYVTWRIISSFII